MKFPFRDFWSRLVVKFGDFTKSEVYALLEVDDYGMKHAPAQAAFPPPDKLTSRDVPMACFRKITTG
jgi:hypothetical protein